METTSPTREIHKRLLFTLHQDGLLDLLAGSIVATFGLVPLLDETGMNPGLRQVIILSIYAASLAAVLILKRKVSRPRSGYVKLTRRTTARISIIMLSVNSLIFIVFLLAHLLELPVWESFGDYSLSFPLGLIFLTMFTMAGGMLKAPRFHIYGILVLMAFLAGELLYNLSVVTHHGIPVAAFFSGGLIMLFGCLQLVRFIKRYGAD